MISVYWLIPVVIGVFIGTLKFAQHNAKKAAAINDKTSKATDALQKKIKGVKS